MKNRSPITLNLLVVSLLVCLIIAGGWGVVLMISILAQGDLRALATGWVHLHGVQQLWGWCGAVFFALIGTALRASLERNQSSLAGATGRLILLASLIAFLSTVFSSAMPVWMRHVQIAASCGLLASTGLLALDILSAIIGTRRGLDLSHLFLLAGAQWMLIWSSTDVFARIRFSDAAVLPDYIRSLLLTLSVFGLIGNIVFAFGLRIWPGFFRISLIRQRAGLLALTTYNAGVLFLAGSAKMGQSVAFFGSLLLLAGTLFYLAGMNFFRKDSAAPLSSDENRGNHVIRAAVIFFLAALLLMIIQSAYKWGVGEPHRSYVGASRHLLMTGFIGAAFMGIGMRMAVSSLPASLAAPQLFRIAAWLLIGGCVWRTVAELMTISGERWTYYVMAPSGLVELAGLILFALLMLRVLLSFNRNSRTYALPLLDLVNMR